MKKLYLLTILFSLLSIFKVDANTAEKVVYHTKFQDWETLKASATETTIDKTTSDGQTLTFTLFNTNVDPAGTNSKFTKEVVSEGYLQTQKDATNVPYITTSALKSITKFDVVQAATGGTRGITIYVKGDGDTDWVELHNKSIATASGEQLSFEVNRTNCQIKFGSFTPSQNAYILELKIMGNVEVEPRTFVDFKIDFRTNPYTVVTPESGLPSGVEVASGSFYDAQHGYSNAKITVPVDGATKFTIGGCGYTGHTATVSVDGGAEISIDTKEPNCDNGFGTYTKYATYTYNSESKATLTFNLGDYCPYFFAEKCEYTPMVTVYYFNTDGKLIGSEEVEGNSALKYLFGASDVTIPEGEAFRGWFDGTSTTALKIKEGKALSEETKLYAKTSKIETATTGSHYLYDLTKNYFYPEDHELFSTDGKYYNNHGFTYANGQSISVKVSSKALVLVGLCTYTNTSDQKVVNDAGEEVATLSVIRSGEEGATTDGSIYSFFYESKNGAEDILHFNFTTSTYIHSIEIYNVENEIKKDETTGYYKIASGDASSLLLAIKAAQNGDKIFLPNGTYDLGEVVLTTISANNVSIIGESMEGTIIKNAPDKSIEGIGTTATLLNTSTNLYIQDLTIQNALDYYATGGTGRAVCLQDKGKNTICKNVRMLSYQDTYYSNSASNFYWEDCEIHGTVDYLCGDGDVVYNRVKFVNESRNKDSKNGSDILCAPFTSASCTWGYVFLDCSIESLCSDFTFARSWGGESKAQFIRTKITDNSLNSKRWTTEGMNVAAYKFKEFCTMDKDGNITTPSSNVVEFTHSSGNKSYETVLSSEEAASYTISNIFGDWNPDKTASQVVNIEDGTIFLVNGEITTVAPTSGKVRIANSRGGFGPEVDAASTSILKIDSSTSKLVDEIHMIDGNIVIIKNGISYYSNGIRIK